MNTVQGVMNDHGVEFQALPQFWSGEAALRARRMSCGNFGVFAVVWYFDKDGEKDEESVKLPGLVFDTEGQANACIERLIHGDAV